MKAPRLNLDSVRECRWPKNGVALHTETLPPRQCGLAPLKGGLLGSSPSTTDTQSATPSSDLSVPRTVLKRPDCTPSRSVELFPPVLWLMQGRFELIASLPISSYTCPGTCSIITPDTCTSVLFLLVRTCPYVLYSSTLQLAVTVYNIPYVRDCEQFSWTDPKLWV